MIKNFKALTCASLLLSSLTSFAKCKVDDQTIKEFAGNIRSHDLNFDNSDPETSCSFWVAAHIGKIIRDGQKLTPKQKARIPNCIGYLESKPKITISDEIKLPNDCTRDEVIAKMQNSVAKAPSSENPQAIETNDKSYTLQTTFELKPKPTTKEERDNPIVRLLDSMLEKTLVTLKSFARKHGMKY